MSNRKFKELTIEGEANSLYKWWKAGNPFAIGFNAFYFQVLRIVPSLKLKNWLYRLAGVKIGKNVAIAGMARLGFYYPELITLKDNCIIGWNALLLEHESVRDKVRKGRITVGKNAMIGADSIILCGIKIGDNAIVGAGSVITKDVAANTFVAGNPARALKRV